MSVIHFWNFLCNRKLPNSLLDRAKKTVAYQTCAKLRIDISFGLFEEICQNKFPTMSFKRKL